MNRSIIKTMNQHRFLFSELVKRDFKKKYKGTILGMGWSMLMPLLMLAVMYLVFSHLFGRAIPHFATYLFCGNVVFAWFSESTNSGMRSIVSNAGIFTKVNVPKYLFLFSRNVQTLLNFGLTLIILFLFSWLDGAPLSWRVVLLAYPILTLLVFNIGMGMILSSLHVFFRDLDYIWSVCLQVLMYASAIFYPIDRLPLSLQKWFGWNPVYRHIAYFREIVLQGVIPGWETHLALAGFAAAAWLVGSWMYRHYNTRFLYYV